MTEEYKYGRFPPALMDLVAIQVKLLKPFYDLGNAAHKIGHALDVAALAIKINASMEAPADQAMVITAAMFHDMFSKDRPMHHIVASKYVMGHGTCLALSRFSNTQLEEIALAVVSHRKSCGPTPISTLAKVVSAADRGEPNANAMLTRAAQWQLHIATAETTYEFMADEIREHILGYYGPEGRTQLEPTWENYFKNELDTFITNVKSYDIVALLKELDKR